MKLIKDPLASPVLKERPLEVAAECSQLISTFREYILRHAEIRWQALTEELQQREPHSLPGLRTTLHRVGLYIEGLWRITTHWVGLKYRFPYYCIPFLT